MNASKQIAIEYVDARADFFCALADTIWENPELSLKEFGSTASYCAALRELGFAVTEKLCGIDTAFCGSYGSGRPVIGILGEFDALSGLSQKAGSAQPEPLVPGGCGHGCGHNLLGAGSLAAAAAVKAYLEKTGRPGTVIFYGCPGEEGGSGKAFMAREGLWKQLDAALSWHPANVNQVRTGTNNSCIQVMYKFHGVSAHAAGDPYNGRSALDAVELMNIGVQFLREHMPSKARIHYAITDAGGRSPNVVQPYASVLYMVRSNHVSEAVELQKRVDDIAKGAALMTGTTFEKQFIDGLADTVPNHTLENVLYRNFEALGVPAHTAEEKAFADALSKTYPGSDALPGIGAEFDGAVADQVRQLRAKANGALNDFLAPLYQGPAFEPGSTDVGDVSWQTATGQIHVAAWPSGSPGHSWQNVSCGGTELGHKAAVHAGKVLAAAAIDLLTDPSLLEAAKAEFRKQTAEGYTCPIPADAVPVVPD